MLRALDGLISTTNDPEMRGHLEHHKEETERHRRLLAERLEAHDTTPSTVKDAGQIFAALSKGIIDMARTDNAGKNLRDGYVAEHLEIMTEDPEALATRIRNAGAVFLGSHTPEAIGDYVGGSNHVLPTARSARFSSGLSVLDFMKRTSLLKCGPDQLRKLGPAAMTLGKAEGLDAHARSVGIRLNQS